MEHLATLIDPETGLPFAHKLGPGGAHCQISVIIEGEIPPIDGLTAAESQRVLADFYMKGDLVECQPVVNLMYLTSLCPLGTWAVTPRAPIIRK